LTAGLIPSANISTNIRMSIPGQSDSAERIYGELRAGIARLEAQGDDRWQDISRSRTVKARQLISGDDPEGGFWIIALMTGWAIRYRLLPDGRRQILQFLIPGDVINLNRLFATPGEDIVQTVTECSLQEYGGEAATEVAQSDVALLADLLRHQVSEVRRLEDRLVDLGRRFAEERIAGLVLELHGRLRERGLANDEAFHLPVRQEHLADALGMTPVHVSRTLRSMRDDDLLSIDHSMLRIHSFARLAAIAGYQQIAFPSSTGGSDS